MVQHLPDARHIFRHDNGGLACSLLPDAPASTYDAIAHGDAEAERLPWRLPQGSDHLVANVVIIRARIWNVARDAGDSIEKVGAGDDSDQLVPAHDRDTFDVAGFHDLHDLIQRCPFGDGARIGRHDVANLVSVSMGEFGFTQL